MLRKLIWTLRMENKSNKCSQLVFLRSVWCFCVPGVGRSNLRGLNFLFGPHLKPQTINFIIYFGLAFDYVDFGLSDFHGDRESSAFMLKLFQCFSSVKCNFFIVYAPTEKKGKMTRKKKTRKNSPTSVRLAETSQLDWLNTNERRGKAMSTITLLNITDLRTTLLTGTLRNA